MLTHNLTVNEPECNMHLFSWITAVMMPPIGLLTGNTDFSHLRIHLKDGPDGEVAIKYGAFIQDIVNFLIIGTIITYVYYYWKQLYRRIVQIIMLWFISFIFLITFEQHFACSSSSPSLASFGQRRRKKIFYQKNHQRKNACSAKSEIFSSRNQLSKFRAQYLAMRWFQMQNSIFITIQETGLNS